MVNRILSFSFIFLMLGSSIVLANNQITDRTVKKATAVRVNPKPPEIDGILNDEVWKNTFVYEDFIQRDPVEGILPTEKTSFRIAYDEEAIYFGIECYDSEPNKIVSRLSRRDSWIEADWVSVSIDSHYDHQTGFWFSTYAEGSIMDGTYSNDSWRDNTWNGVWEVKTRIHDKGWTAEYKIPYHVLRFSPKEEYVWGMNVERYICRKKERDQWTLIRKDKPGLVSQFGILNGISNIHPPMHLEFIPYTMGRTILDDEKNYFGGIGTDIRHGITSGISFNATINPDFGQVEEDPSRLNLTAFEDFFPERRPFFVEGASIFQNFDYSIFHSRRIGKKPGYFALPEGIEEIKRPDSTTILFAGKLTGKTENKTSFGILNAVTAPEYAKVKGNKKQYLIEPLTNYFVSRLEKDIFDGTSKVGFFATAVNRKDADSAYTGALDCSLKFFKNKYQFTGTLAGSKKAEQKNGYISHLEFDKLGGWFNAEIGASAISPDLDINDIGFIRRGNLIRSWSRLMAYRNNQLGPFQQFDMESQGSLVWNYDGIRIRNGFDISSWGEFRNYWEFHLHYGKDFASMNDDDVFRGGVIIKKPSSYFIHGSIRTDDRKAICFNVRPEFVSLDDGLSYRRGLNLGMEIRPSSNIWFLIQPSYSHGFSYAQWIGNFDNRYIYGELDSKTLDLTTRASIYFTSNLSLEFYIQPFIAIGDFENVKELVRPQSYEFRSYMINENYDFHSRSLKGNTVLRWEFRPGSTLFIVWTQSRRFSPDIMTEEYLDFRPLDYLKDSFSDNGYNLFLIKLSYWIGV